MQLQPCPDLAAWVHQGARTGFEVLFAQQTATGYVLRGHTTAMEAGAAWSVGYELELDADWRTVKVLAAASGAQGQWRTAVERSSGDRWTVDGVARPELDGCVDIDFESSAVTNTLPVHRLDLEPGVEHDVPAAFIRADNLRAERLEQTYRLRERDERQLTIDYRSPTFDFACTLTYDPAGLIVDYPGIASRHH